MLQPPFPCSRAHSKHVSRCCPIVWLTWIIVEYWIVTVSNVIQILAGHSRRRIVELCDRFVPYGTGLDSHVLLAHFTRNVVIKIERWPVYVLPFVQAWLCDMVLQRTDGAIGVFRWSEIRFWSTCNIQSRISECSNRKVCTVV
jgi:hypothetical protein